jgi:hypothetical protein
MDNRPYRSLFWPIILIGVGVIWLLGTLGIIPPANLGILGSLWPLILIVIGLDILFGRRSALIGALIGLFAIAVVVFALIAGPALGLPSGSVLQSRSINEPIGSATSAEITLNTSSQPVRINALQNTESLLQAEIDYFGNLQYSSSGNPVRRIRLERTGSVNFGVVTFDSNARWDISLSPRIPLDLRIDAGSGSNNLDLSELQLTGLDIDQGSGSMTLRLPASTQPYTASINGGSGSLTVDLPDSGNLTLRLDGGSGSLNINVPQNVPLRLEVRDDGSGSVNVPARLVRISGQDKEGVWETPSFESAANKILIICNDLGSGSFNLR